MGSVASIVDQVTIDTSNRSVFDDIELEIDRLAIAPMVDPARSVADLLHLGERVLELWVEGRGGVPTLESKEGFRLLALHRQGAKGEPSFNACRETCRELIYHYNLVTLDPSHPETTQRVKIASLVARHLCLFVAGKMQVEGLGEFCCSSKPLRGDGK